ncbi:FAD-dependent monooxygenase [Blastopirellula marina]|uniref:FAD-dependent monooxygenase n=1 Tax=Blastopirellula marina TaxID=124 RepID=A0A2S8G3Z0_9BACT|nr:MULTISPECIES: NAD(P)/FAD-dependent oxidoreductase [Pirellulaceae]PQO39143.1 FAD-dependent monooxygenase [Blastopirellula marina]RCS55451.1 FAD-dependent monooxygenase [Bremerella cremea]
MIADRYDIVTIGGGMGGATLAKTMAQHGARVLVLEKDRTFKDRVRGDAMAPWGSPEAKTLGIFQLLLDTCAQEVPWVDGYLGKMKLEHRHLPTTTRCQSSELAFHHPQMQEVLIQAASDAGATVLRGAVARDVQTGPQPAVTYMLDGVAHTVQARIVIGADGRTSACRRIGDFEVLNDPPERILSGVLMDGMNIPQDTSVSIFDTRQSQLVALFPQGGQRVRVYFSYLNTARPRLQGPKDVNEVVEQCIISGAEPQWFEGSEAVAPLASFPSDDIWIPHPYKNGIALIGDAAANNDPMFGQGMAVTLRDVRELTDRLKATDDWDAAGHGYAETHDHYFNIIHTYSHWFERLFYSSGKEGDALRFRVLPLLAKDHSRMPDYLLSGPDGPVTEEIRQRMFGEDVLPAAASSQQTIS